MVYSKEQRLWRYRIFAVTWVAYAGFYFCRKNFSVAMPLLDTHLGYSNKALADVIFLYSLFYALGQFYNGVLSDRFGARLVVGVGLLVSVFSNVAMGFGISLAMLGILACLNGTGQSTGWSGLVKNMTPWFRSRERGIVMAWWGTNYVLGGLIATVFATFAATNETIWQGLGWRRVFWAPSVILLACSIIFILIARNKPSDVGIPPIQEDDNEGGRDDSWSAAGTMHPPEGSKAIFLDVISNPSVWLTAVFYFFLKMTRYSFIFWLPKYMTDRLGYGLEEAGYTSALYEFVGFSGALVAGYVSDRLMQSRRFPVGAMMMWGLAVVCLFHPMLAAWGRLGNAIGIALIGFMTFGPDTLMTGAAAQDMGGRHGAATAAGFINGVGSIGQMCSPLLVAYVADAYGWDYLFYLFVIFSLVGGSLLATKWNYVPRLASAEEGRG
jgi:OPA family glycerol-3-phosphate transporter-like MFS transporter